MVARRTLESGLYSLDVSELYARMWDAAEESADGGRLYVSQGDASLNWLIAELAGTPAEVGKTLPANNAIRKQVHAFLIEEGWADRINERQFRLLLPPDRTEPRGVVGFEVILGAYRSPLSMAATGSVSP